MSLNIQPNTKMINNNGLFMLLSISTKPLAKIFMQKYLEDIMPKITKTGIYISSQEDMEKINELNNKIDQLQDKITNLSEENDFLESKHRFVASENGYGYIHRTDCINNGVKTKCYKFGVTKNIKKRIAQYKTGNPTYKMLYYMPLDFDMFQLESCVEAVLKPHQIKANNETLTFISLIKLKEVINKCANLIMSHMCSCKYCKTKTTLKKNKCKKNNNLKFIKPI